MKLAEIKKRIFKKAVTKALHCGAFSLFLLFSPTLSAQDEVADSLKKVVNTMPADSNKVNTLIDLAAKYYRSDPETARGYAQEANDLATEISFARGVGYSHKALGMSYYFQNNWIDALVQWEKALEVFESIEHLTGVSNMLNNLGAVHFNGGDNESALEFYLGSLKVAESLRDTLRTVSALINIGTVYLDKKSHYDLAFNYYQRALPISRSIEDYDALGTCAVNLGTIYLSDTTKLDSALYYFELALDAYQKSATGNVAFALKNIGQVYAQRGDYEEALKFQSDAYNLAKSQDARLEMAQSLQSMAMTYEMQGDHRKSIETYELAKELSRELEAAYEVQAAYEGLAKNYFELNDFQNAYIYQKLFSSLKDTLYNAEMDKQLQSQTLHYEIEKKQGQISLLEKDQELKEVQLERQKAIRNAAGIVGILLLLLAAGLFNRYKYTRRTSKIIANEKERSDKLLLNILPTETADELKEKGSATPRYYEQVSVLFTDFKGFTKIAEKLTPQELVEELNHSFIAFDDIIDKYELEKIKTIGDAYMCAGGIPVEDSENPHKIVRAALEIRDFMENLRKEREAKGEEFWELRIGIHTGPVIAGVVGKNKFAYDIWGDAVNTASRMESSGIPGEVNISGTTYEIVKNDFNCVHRGKIQAKNKGEIDMYLVEGLKESIAAKQESAEGIA